MAVQEDIHHRIIGDSPALKETLKQARIAVEFTVKMPLLLVGEPGTGKELIAQYIHALSATRGPFIAINCAALSPGLIESELFGHDSGAFTGATKEKAGAFERANGGTLFLDEIHTLLLEHQSKLNRVLSEMEIQRVGGSRIRKLDFRLITATNCDLYKMVQNKTFKEDLFDRLNVFTIEVPSLRERPEDIIPISRYILKSMAPQKRFSQESEDFLRENICPGNIRVLKNLIIAATAQSSNSNIIGLQHIERHLKWKLPGYEEPMESQHPTQMVEMVEDEKTVQRYFPDIVERSCPRDIDREESKLVIPLSEEKTQRKQGAERTSSRVPKEIRHKIILSVLEGHSPSAASDFRAATGASKATTERDLKELVDRDIILRIGQGKTTCYVLEKSKLQKVDSSVDEAQRDQGDVEANRDHACYPAEVEEMLGDVPRMFEAKWDHGDHVENPRNGFVRPKELRKEASYIAILTAAVDEKAITELMAVVGRKNRSKFRKNFVYPLLDAGLLAMTCPENPKNSRQKYITTIKGNRAMKENNVIDLISYRRYGEHESRSALTATKDKTRKTSPLGEKERQILEFTLEPQPLKSVMSLVGRSSRSKFRNRFIRPLVDAGLLALTIPDKPQSGHQRYVTTKKGRTMLKAAEERNSDANYIEASTSTSKIPEQRFEPVFSKNIGGKFSWEKELPETNSPPGLIEIWMLIFCSVEKSAEEMLEHFEDRKLLPLLMNIICPLLLHGHLAMTVPGKSIISKEQRFRTTEAGKLQVTNVERMWELMRMFFSSLRDFGGNT